MKTFKEFLGEELDREQILLTVKAEFSEDVEKQLIDNDIDHIRKGNNFSINKKDLPKFRKILKEVSVVFETNINEQITTFELKGQTIDFKQNSFIKDKAINILMKVDGFDENKLKMQLGDRDFPLTFKTKEEAEKAYDILKVHSDIEKVTWKDAEELAQIFFVDLNKALKGRGLYKFKHVGTNAMNVLIDGIVVAKIVIDPSNKF